MEYAKSGKLQKYPNYFDRYFYIWNQIYSILLIHLGNLSGIHKVLASGVSVDARDYFNRTALHFAAQSGKSPTHLHWQLSFLSWQSLIFFTGRVEIVRALLDLGAAVDAEDEQKRQPIHYAAFDGELIILLSLQVFGFSMELFFPFQDMLMQFELLSKLVQT